MSGARAYASGHGATRTTYSDDATDRSAAGADDTEHFIEEERAMIDNTRLMRNGNAPVLSLRDAMDRLLEQSFTPFTRAVGTDYGQGVAANLWEDANSYYLHLVAPGLDLASVDITAMNGVLTVSGQMAQAAPAEGAKAIWQEWSPSTFRRQVQLPAGFDADRCQATYKDGILSVTIAKPEQIKPKSIKVQVQE
jgi:HSP20 family protein